MGYGASLQILLESAGYTVQWAGDLATALVILEERLPDGSGLDLCREVKAGSAAVPTVVLASWVSSEARSEAVAAGADGFLMKPFDVDELFGIVQRLLGDDQASPSDRRRACRPHEESGAGRPGGSSVGCCGGKMAGGAGRNRTDV